MKTLCPKPGKGGKIHPSPAEDPIAAAFRLLPATILVLVAGLTPEDKRVLAHLVTRSFLVGWDAATVPPSEQARGSGRRRRGHPPTVGCLCFECYGSFWTRWGCSPQHDRIHAALEAFEEHLNAAESAAASSSATPPSSKRRDKGKRGRAAAATPSPPPQPPIRSRPKSPEPPAVAEAIPEPASPPPPSCPPPTPPPAPAACLSENKENVPEAPTAEATAEECGGEVAAEAEEERKRGWADVMGGVLNLRRWGIWSPAVESAT
ncbi:hypothetical protein PAHAL_1G241600 [Panicum hallii]|uniref:Uncharacterized protein n=1 Tax=Panicum hallii TaxID=206008 RepID=A0A2T8KW79_9POAL|nr:proline-rich protein 12-like [Panicum hallii]PVH66425.1 hypothetical protein PAHAL_1G241600 [Panicum hallii]